MKTIRFLLGLALLVALVADTFGQGVAIRSLNGKGTNINGFGTTKLLGGIQLGDAGEVATTESSNTFRFRGTVHAHDSFLMQALTGDRVLYLGPGKDILSSAGVTSAELEFLDGVTSGIQAQIDGVAAGALPSYSISNNFTATFTNLGPLRQIGTLHLGAGQTNNSAAMIDSSTNVVGHPTVSATELGFLDGVTGAIQTAINGLISRALTNEDTRPITLYSTITNPNAFYLNAGIAYLNNRRAPESDGFNTNYVIPLYEGGEDEWYIIMTNHVHFRSFSNGIQNPAYRGFAGVTLTNFTATDKTLSFTNTWIPMGLYSGVVPAGKYARVEFQYDAGGVPRYTVQIQGSELALQGDANCIVLLTNLTTGLITITNTCTVGSGGPSTNSPPYTIPVVGTTFIIDWAALGSTNDVILTNYAAGMLLNNTNIIPGKLIRCAAEQGDQGFCTIVSNTPNLRFTAVQTGITRSTNGVDFFVLYGYKTNAVLSGQNWGAAP